MKRLVMIAILFTVGCTSQAPELKQYLLRTDTPNRIEGQNPAAVIGIGACGERGATQLALCRWRLVGRLRKEVYRSRG